MTDPNGLPLATSTRPSARPQAQTPAAPPDSAPVSRLERRKERTRQALIEAAQQLIAAGRAGVSIQEITDRADVGFGSFYNHFASKDELFEAATDATLEDHIARINSLTAGLADPAEVFSLGFRLTGRLQRVYPDLMRVLVRSAPNYLLSETSLAAEARRDIRAAAERGRFDLDESELELALASVSGVMVGLLQLLDERPELDAATVTDAVAVRVLRMLGLSRRQAAALVSRPVPALPSPA